MVESGLCAAEVSAGRVAGFSRLGARELAGAGYSWALREACRGVAGLEWAAAALEELLVLGAWIRMLRARHSRLGINTYVLYGKVTQLKKLIEALYEYIERLEA